VLPLKPFCLGRMEPPPSHAPSATPPLGGIHISRGVRLRIPVGGLIIRAGSGDGPRMEVAVVELQLDTCVHWLEIALEHLANAEQAHEALLSEPRGSRDVGSLLDREFKSSVQAAFAAATFFEALYATTVERNPPKTALAPGKPRRRPTRFAIVTEQLRRSFGLRKKGTANLRSVLSEVYRFRDQAVHPSAAFSEPVLHPELGIGVERRFVMFCAASAHQLVRAALAFSKILPSRDLTRQPKEIQDLGAYLLEVCSPLYALWEREHGQLLDVSTNAT
jgi:hypothetical protein